MYSLNQMFNIMLNELKYSKKYFLNKIALHLSSYIFIFGIIFSTNNKVEIVLWFILSVSTGRVCEHFYELIKNDGVNLILSSSTSIFKYSLLYSISIYIYSYVISIPLFLFFYKEVTFQLIIYSLTSWFLITICVSIIISLLTIVYKRVAVGLSIFLTYVLFYSGLVYDTSFQIQLFLGLRIESALNVKIVYLFISAVITIIIYVILIKKIKKCGTGR